MQQFTDTELDLAFETMSSTNIYQISDMSTIPRPSRARGMTALMGWLCVTAVLIAGLIVLIDDSEARWLVNRIATPLFLW